MKRWERKKQTGFTIVELLIVVVVIAILAAITIVAYSGIRERATTSHVQSALSQAHKKIVAHAALNADQYPATLADAGVTGGGVVYQYTSDNSVQPGDYAITASSSVTGGIDFYVSSTKPQITAGIAPGHNIMPWDEPSAASAPVRLESSGTVAIDTTEFRSSPASIRIVPGATGKRLRLDPINGSAGQLVTISLWLKSDSNWNGLGNNSKIRIGTGNAGSLITACSYNGIKLTWTEVVCTYALTSTNTSIAVSVGNDGTLGNIWIDDLSVSVR